MSAWAAKFVGLKYEPAPGHDCLWFVHHVLTEQYGQDRLRLPPHTGEAHHLDWLAQARELMAASTPTDQLQDGFICVFNPPQTGEHTGVIVMGHEPMVLHSESRNGYSAIQPLRLLKRALKLTGIYNPFIN